MKRRIMLHGQELSDLLSRMHQDNVSEKHSDYDDMSIDTLLDIMTRWKSYHDGDVYIDTDEDYNKTLEFVPMRLETDEEYTNRLDIEKQTNERRKQRELENEQHNEKMQRRLYESLKKKFEP